jgi:ribosomal subunit interface protein
VTHHLEFRNWEPNAGVQELVEQSIARIDRLVTGYSWEPVFLRVFVEWNAARTLYRVSLTLDVPGRTLAAQEERHDVRDAIHEAFAEIERQSTKYRETQRGEDDYKRPARRAHLQRHKQAVPSGGRK